MKNFFTICIAISIMINTAFATTINRNNLEPGTQIRFAMGEFHDAHKIYIHNQKNVVDLALIPPKVYNISNNGKPEDILDYYKGDLTILGHKWEYDYGRLDDGKTDGFLLHTKADEFNSQKDIDAKKLEIDRYARHDIQPYDFTAKNFRVTINATTGRNLIKSTEFDGTGSLIITLTDDYRTPSTTGPDLVLTELAVHSTNTVYNQNGEKVLYPGRKFVADIQNGGGGLLKTDSNNIVTIGVVPVEIPLTGGEEILSGDGEWTKFTSDEGVHRGTVKFDNPSSGIVVSGTVYNGDVVSFKYDDTPSDTVINILQNNPNANVNIHNIIAKGFKGGFTVLLQLNSVYGATTDENGNINVLSVIESNNKKLYVVSHTGILKAAPFTYNSATGTWQGKLPSSGGTLLVSDVELKGTTAINGNTGTNNPNTGFGIDFVSAIVR